MQALAHSLSSNFVFNKYAFINSIKAILACLLGLLVTRLIHLAQPQWVLISIVIVMAAQYRLGGAMLKGYARLFATAIGSALAAAILFLFSDHPLVIYLVLFLFIGTFIYFATNSKEYSYSYALGAVTMIIIVISNNPSLRGAFDRLVEILIGVLIAISVSRFVLPVRAESILRENIALTLNKLKKVYQYSIREEKTFTLQNDGSNLEEKIIQNLAAQPILLKEACTESLAFRNNKFKFIVILRLERRLLRSIYMLHFTLRISLRKFSSILSIPEFNLLHNQVLQILDELAIKITRPNYSLPEIDIDATYNDIVKKIRTLFELYSFEDKNKIHSFIFCQGHLISILNRLKKVILETCQSRTALLNRSGDDKKRHL